LRISINLKDFRRISVRNVRDALNQALDRCALLAWREMGALAWSGIFKRPTGEYARSIYITRARGVRRIGPHVAYQWWIEHGARGRFIPPHLRKSTFMGYQIVGKTARKIEPLVKNLAGIEIERRVS